ncbi:M1 family peptidase [Aquimarina sp. AD1]|uniref:M1 family metallopeptidase n=1 Tax=Aquimarina sp. (strain AD1) TaxID=1714848 RepID=UPI000E4A7D24|nr:M1 family metallopeptidase [Aquimarina sp. AD1]AXT57285.1 M1 family peptidase [Aquimarina sp. AD1]RKN20802.1 M1 family peptidase [Aquimarina sp. AD1]
MISKIISIGFLISVLGVSAQNNTSYWQQHVDYKMNVDMNVENFQYKGTQELVYTNNSPDSLYQVFYHLYFNAFQPGSEMDVRSRNIEDPDPRVMDRISKLTPEEIGYLKISSLKQNGKEVTYEIAGTVLEVELNEPIAPGKKVTFSMNFDGQVPNQIRRSGRNSSEGVALSMTQWYPKMAEYDFEGWHADPYIAREFHGVWGNFDVTINIDKNYILGGSGYLQNPQEIGYGYEKPGTKIKRKGKKLSWHFIAPNVHDFTWAADPEYIHDTVQVPDGPVLHFLYKNKEEYLENWKKLQPKSVDLMKYFSTTIGKYPYDQYSIIQGGDGGMEYAMCTLITGGRSFGSLVGVTAHEMAHAWFQHILATNEAKHEWMDEGFTSYISTLAMDKVMEQNKNNPMTGMYRGYFQLATSGIEQPQSTHADRYTRNGAYGASAYAKGAVFMAQLGYVIGEENLSKTIHRYFDEWKFKHPTPNDFKRIAEKVSGIQLDWYLTDWTQTTNTVDYGIKEVSEKGNTTSITLERIGLMPMPVDLYIEYMDGTKESFYIPLRMMRKNKTNPFPKMNRTILSDWTWTHPNYSLEISKYKSTIKSIEIDITKQMADININNNNFSQ